LQSADIEQPEDREARRSYDSFSTPESERICDGRGDDVYNCISLAITRYMFWEAPSSFEAYAARREATLRSINQNDVSFVIHHVPVGGGSSTTVRYAKLLGMTMRRIRLIS
jgi:hypothetical protein